jgi:hypothetical protein
VTGEQAIRWSTVAAVTGVAAVAGIVSYRHALTVVRAHGEGGVVALVYPGTIDGLIYAASMALLNAARRGRRAHPLAGWLLGAGITATLAANVAAGIAYGPIGAVVAAWPAGALVGSYELLMLIIRESAVPAAVPAVPGASNEPAAHLAEAQRVFSEEIAAGVVPPIRRIRAALSVGQSKASEARAYLAELTRT